jgi:hypothetical protein
MIVAHPGIQRSGAIANLRVRVFITVQSRAGNLPAARKKPGKSDMRNDSLYIGDLLGNLPLTGLRKYLQAPDAKALTHLKRMA